MMGMSEFTLTELAKEKQKIDLQRSAMALLARQASGKPGFECALCHKVGALLLQLGRVLSEVTDNKAGVLPDNELEWPEVLENRRTTSYFA